MRSCNRNAPLIIQEGRARAGQNTSPAAIGAEPLTQQFLSTDRRLEKCLEGEMTLSLVKVSMPGVGVVAWRWRGRLEWAWSPCRGSPDVGEDDDALPWVAWRGVGVGDVAVHDYCSAVHALSLP
jgi:hypothetical protein